MRHCFALLLISVLVPATLASARPDEGRVPEAIQMSLWNTAPPTNNGLTGPERGSGCVGNISKATLTIHLPAKDQATGAAVVITPGGGYGVVCVESEGRQIADLLVPRGIAAIVVKYRLPNGHHEIPANDARRAMRTVRHHASDWKIDPKRVGIWGFSAGGHLASTVATAFDAGDADAKDPVERESSRPDFAILFYPVISMEGGVTHGGSRRNLLGPDPAEEKIARYSNETQVNERTPPTFLLHAGDDRAVPVENSLRYYRQLVRHRVPADLLIFERGGHGPGAFKNNPSWQAAFDQWLRRRKCL
ncbi:MAG: alpha/beta hydrolase [Phycisphaerae bacterium]|nr:alpha/beta hydrolase [Phycisphaerae bacterium]